MVHLFCNNGYYIAVDPASGSVHSLDEVAYDVISLFEDKTEDQIVAALLEKYRDRPDVTEDEIRECCADVEELKEAGTLFSEDEFRDLGPKDEKSPVKALCLHVAHTCNLNCEYCFAAQGKYSGDPTGKKPALMSFEVAKAAIDFLIKNSGTRRNLEVDFFGGEPLMNFEVVKKTVAYARSVEKEAGKNFRFTLTTNGVLLDDEVTEYCNREMNNVVLSLDGRREVHDRFRRFYDGRGSYDEIVPKFQRFVEKRGNRSYYVRGTFTHMNTDFTEDLFHMADLGFRELSMEPVVCKPGDPYALTEDDLPVLFGQYDILAREMLKREREGDPITFYHYMIDLTEGPCIYKRITGCGSGFEYMAVTPWGELFPCHQFVNDPDYSLGNVFEGVKNQALSDKFRSCGVYSHPECADCWARLWCAGGCAANAYHATGDIAGVYEYGCRLFRHRLECAIMMNVAREEEKQG